MTTQTEQDTGGDLITQAEAAERRLAERSPAIPAETSIDPMALIARAIDRGYDENRLEKLMALQERWEANQARKAFHAALAAFRAENVQIFPNRKADFENTKQQKVSWEYADIGEMMGAVNPVLGKHGLSLTWKARQDGGNVIVSAVLSHAQGHECEPVTLQSGPDNSGSKNSLQALKSTRTSLMRQTGELVLGVAARGPEGGDDDGQGSSQPALIGGAEFAFLNAEIAEIGDALDLPKFLEYLGVESIEELHAADFGKAKTALEAKRRKLAEGTAPAEDADDLNADNPLMGG